MSATDRGASTERYAGHEPEKGCALAIILTVALIIVAVAVVAVVAVVLARP